MQFFRPRGSRRGLDEGRADVVLGGGAPGDLPRPVSRARIEAWCTAEEFTYFVDNEGDLGGFWNNRLFYFLVFGDRNEVLQVRAHWNREVNIERLEEILDLCNAWNAERVWPKVYVRVLDNGSVNVMAESSHDLEQGVTDTQLARLLSCAVGTGTLFFDEVDGLYPDPAAQAP